MQTILAELEKRLANVVRRGVIHAVDLSGPTPRCRVAFGKTVTQLLPLCQFHGGKYRQSFCPVAVGDPVTVLSEGGDLANGQVYPGWSNATIPAPDGDKNTHIDVFDDGLRVSYDRTSHEYIFRLPEGGKYTLSGNGTLDGNVVITGDTEMKKTLRVAGDITSGANISDASGSMATMRVQYNGHTHIGFSGIITSTPSTPMRSLLIFPLP